MLNTIKLYQFPRPAKVNFPNLSPYCVKLETYLKLANINFDNHFTLNNSKNIKKTLPFIEINNQIVGDTTLIIEELIKSFGDRIDNNLTHEQQAVARAFITMLENHFNPIMLYYRWVNPKGWQIFRNIIFAQAPWIIKILVGNKLARKVKKSLYMMGTARFNETELLHLAKLDLEALASYLGDKQFFFGEKPTTLDIVVFSIIGNITLVPIENDLQNLTKYYTNLTQHALRMHQIFYKN